MTPHGFYEIPIKHGRSRKQCCKIYVVMFSKPGHHQTAIQTLPTTLGVDPRTVVRLDALRKQRNLTEYTGDIIPDSAVIDCLTHAQSLYALTLDWLENNKRELL
jgi:hypothetical protein